MKPTLRCSSLDKLLTCPGSLTLEAKVAASTLDFGDSEGGHAVTWAGIWCHHRAASILRDEHDATGEPGPLKLPSSFQPSGYDEWVAEWYAGRVVSSAGDNPIYIERELVREFERFTLSGHIDACSINGDCTEAVIDDLKRGYDPVDSAEYNWQLAGYCALLALEYPSLRKVTLRIHQPTQDVRTSECVVLDPQAVILILRRYIERSLADPYTFETGKPCKYCAGIEVCPTFRKDVKIMRETLTKEFIDELSGVASITDLGDLAHHAAKLDYPLKRVREAFKLRLEQEGRPVFLTSGVEAALVDEEGNREITDPRFAHSILAGKVGETAAWATLKMSVGGVEDVLVESGMKRTSKKDVSAKSWVSENLGGVIARKPQKTVTFK